MEFETLTQKEINKIEKRIYIIRSRPFKPNLKEKPLTGKFYARHDNHDESIIDPEMDRAVYEAHMLGPKDKYKEPLTTNMEYGWYTHPRVFRTRWTFHFPRTSSQITRIGCIIAMEDQKVPKKPFTGKSFTV